MHQRPPTDVLRPDPPPAAKPVGICDEDLNPTVVLTGSRSTVTTGEAASMEGLGLCQLYEPCGEAGPAELVGSDLTPVVSLQGMLAHLLIGSEAWTLRIQVGDREPIRCVVHVKALDRC